MNKDDPKKQGRARTPSATDRPKFVGIPENWETMTEAQQDQAIDQMVEALFGPFADDESE